MVRSGSRSRRSVCAWLGVALAMVGATRALANGRVPGATELTISRHDPSRSMAGATLDLVQSFDGGASWEWACEEALDVSGEADPPLALAAGGALVLLPPT